MYQYPFFSMYDPNVIIHLNVCIHKYKYSYKCKYVLSSKSPLRLVVNRKSSRTLSALA